MCKQALLPIYTLFVTVSFGIKITGLKKKRPTAFYSGRALKKNQKIYFFLEAFFVVFFLAVVFFAVFFLVAILFSTIDSDLRCDTTALSVTVHLKRSLLTNLRYT